MKTVVDIKPDKTVALIDKTKPGANRRQSAQVKHHDKTTDFLARYGFPTDGSVIIHRPGTENPFDHHETPYDELETGAEVPVVANTPSAEEEPAETPKRKPRTVKKK